MTELADRTLSAVGFDAVALKPAEVDLRQASALDIDIVTVDYEGPEHVPSADTLRALSEEFEVRTTVPVRADGFDPLGDDSRLDDIPDAVGEVLVAGHPTYLTHEERTRAVAPRLETASRDSKSPWVGTEGVERLALAIGGTQFDLLSSTTAREVYALRMAGFEGEIAVYAPTVLSDDADTVLDAVGTYAARRGQVNAALPANAPQDSSATGKARETLLSACHEYGLVGDAGTVARRISELREMGVDYVVGYPARGLEPVLE